MCQCSLEKIVVFFLVVVVFVVVMNLLDFYIIIRNLKRNKRTFFSAMKLLVHCPVLLIKLNKDEFDQGWYI